MYPSPRGGVVDMMYDVGGTGGRSRFRLDGRDGKGLVGLATEQTSLIALPNVVPHTLVVNEDELGDG